MDGSEGPQEKAQGEARVAATDEMATSDGDRIPCYFDGACARNQFKDKGPMRAAYVIGDREFVRQVPDLVTAKRPLRSNNIAEYHGLIFLLRHLLET